MLLPAISSSDTLDWEMSTPSKRFVYSLIAASPRLSTFLNISSQGTIAISKFTSKLNNILLSQPGHKQYFTHLKHAAYSQSRKILFLNRGVDVSRPLSAQNDCFWWGYHNFSDLQKPYNTFSRIVRGYKSSQNNDLKNIKKSIVCSLFKQPLDEKEIIAGIFDESGNILDLFESK